MAYTKINDKESKILKIHKLPEKTKKQKKFKNLKQIQVLSGFKDLHVDKKAITALEGTSSALSINLCKALL